MAGEVETLGEKLKRLQKAAYGARWYVDNKDSKLTPEHDDLHCLALNPAFADYIIGLERDKAERVQHFADARRIVEWATGSESALKEPSLAFTAGPERTIADLLYRVSEALERATAENAELQSSLAAKDAEIARVKKRQPVKEASHAAVKRGWQRGYVAGKRKRDKDADDKIQMLMASITLEEGRAQEFIDQLAAANKRIEELEAMEAILDNRKGEL